MEVVCNLQNNQKKKHKTKRKKNKQTTYKQRSKKSIYFIRFAILMKWFDHSA